jgi:hypothetical protein
MQALFFVPKATNLPQCHFQIALNGKKNFIPFKIQQKKAFIIGLLLLKIFLLNISQNATQA